MSKRKLRNICIIIGVILFLTAIGIIMLSFNEEKNRKNELKVGLILTGTKDEGGWNSAHFDGASAACSQLDAQLVIKENIIEGSGECVSAVADLVEQDDVKIIFLAGYGFGKEITEICDQYPEVMFYTVDFNSIEENVSAFFGRMYQAKYLAGIVAGNMTKTNQIGYVAAMDTPEVIRGINAFTLGVRKANPKAEISVLYTGTWENEDKERSAANRLIEESQADVLAYHQNTTYVVEEAEKAGIYSIGYHYDDAEKFSENYLTSAIWNFKDIYTGEIKRFLSGKNLGNRTTWLGLLEGTVKLGKWSPLVSEDIKEQVKEAESQIESGVDVFYGPIYSNKGELMVEEGESIPDSFLLEEFDWYVEGVTVKE